MKAMARHFPGFLRWITGVLVGGLLWAAPHLEVSSREHNFGLIDEGKIYTHDFLLKNTGTDTLKILSVRTSCGCTATLLKSTTIAPGDSEVLHVSFNSTGYGGRSFVKVVSIRSNDPEQPEVRVLLRGEVKALPKPRGYVYPSLLNLGQVKPGTVVLDTVLLISDGQLPLVLESINGFKGVEVLGWSPDTLAPGDTGRIFLKITVDESRPYSGVLMLKTNDGRLPHKFVRVIANQE